MNLQTRWEQLWFLATNDTTSIQAAFARICARYTEPHRAYHTLRHIRDCLSVLDEFRELASDPRIVEAALWWHDLIYDTKAFDNTCASAEIARTDMRLLGCTSEFEERVTAAILATKHNSVVQDPDQQLVVDIDLHALGVSETRYAWYAAAVRKEFEWVPWRTYARKRAEFLETFLNREHIYYLPPLREAYERHARVNIHKEIRFLRMN